MGRAGCRASDRALARARRAALGLGVGIGLALAGPPAGAQVASGDAAQGVAADASLPAPILTIDQDRFFAESAFGLAALARAEADGAALSDENQRIEAALEAEERTLTDRRAQISPEEFSPLAKAFDTKVEEIRAAQVAKQRAITRRLEDDRRAFYEVGLPLLGEILEQSGALAILDRGSVVVSLRSVDVTDAAIARVNVALPPAPAP